MLTCWPSQWKSGLQAWWGQRKKSPYCPVIFIYSSSSSPLPLSNTLINFSHSAFFPSLPIWSAFILWDWGREAVTGWNAWANAAFHVRKGAAPGVCVCVCDVCGFWSQRYVTHLCRLRRFDRLKSYYSIINPEWNSYVFIQAKQLCMWIQTCTVKCKCFQRTIRLLCALAWIFSGLCFSYFCHGARREQSVNI